MGLARARSSTRLLSWLSLSAALVSLLIKLLPSRSIASRSKSLTWLAGLSLRRLLLAVPFPVGRWGAGAAAASKLSSPG